jgi:restriction endonuclease S subunit
MNKQTQKRCLDSIDELIKLEKEKVELLEKHKKGLIQKFEKNEIEK